MRTFLPSRLLAVLGLTLLATQPLWAAGLPPADDLAATVGRMARIGFCSSPSFSPDGQRLAFVANLSGVPQVWTVAVGGGWPEQVTALEDQVGGVEWSPDGRWLAFSLAPGGGMNQQIYLVRPDGRDLKRLTAGGKDNNWLGGWSHDGRQLAFSSNQDGETMDDYLWDATTGQARRVVRNPGTGELADLSRDGRLATLGRVASRGDSNLFLLDLATGRETLLTPHQPPGNYAGGAFSPDGRTLYLSSDGERDLAVFSQIRLDPQGRPGPIEVLAERKDAELESFTLTEDGKTAALVWNVAGKSELAFLDLPSRRLRSGPVLPSDVLGGLRFSRDGRKLVFVLSGATRPADLWVLDLPSGQLTQVTHSPHAGVDLEALVRPELAHFQAEDGLALSGWLYRPLRPAGVTGPTPYVLSFHGGPEGQERPSFRSDYQALLARGIGVFAPNVRGSSGFGKRFVNLDNGALRVGAVHDIKASVDFLVSQKIADPKRIGIMGGSYGGYMVMAGLTEYPDLFAAGADLFGVVNFETFFAHTEPWMAAISTVEYGDPKTQLQMLKDLSPIHKVDRVKAPTIVLHGANDTNVPVVEAEQVVASLKERNVPVEYVLFPDEGHGFRKTPNRIRSAVSIVQWFEKYLKDPV
ncbi:MAG TPA: S9 family peptidase [Thermoanaerobaculia bacterium]|nr:S9 family peptidase [Thermoanaerobaculia bacterium]